MGDAEDKNKRKRLLDSAIISLGKMNTVQLGESVRIFDALTRIPPADVRKARKEVEAALEKFLSKIYTVKPVMFVSFKTRFGLKEKGNYLVDKNGKKIATFEPHTKTEFGAVRSYMVSPINPTPAMTKWFDKWSGKAKTTQPAKRKKGGIIQEL